MINDEPKDEQKEIPTWLICLVGFSITVAVLLIGFYFWKFSGGLAEKQDVWGQFGDYVGGILNPLFSLTALFALLYTIHLQSKELHESTKQLTASAKALALQNNVMARQQFETTFFQMLGLFNEVINSLYLFRDGDEFKGRQIITKIHAILLEDKFLRILLEDNYSRIYDGQQVAEINNNEYSKFYNEFGFLLGHYFRPLYNIIKFIDNSSFLKDEDKKFYTNIVRAQLSEHELGLLFFNCIYLGEAQKKFLPLVKKYKLLKYLNDSRLTDPAHRDLLSL